MYDGDGVTTIFNGPMAYSATHITAALVEIATGVVSSAGSFTVTQLGKSAGTRVTMAVAPPALYRLVLLRTLPYSQIVDITNQGAFNANVLEQGMDLLDMQIQQLADEASRVPQLGDADIDGSGAYQGNGNRLSNLADAVNSQDAATLGQINDLISIPTGPFIQVASGAVGRPVQDKLRDDPVSLLDFVPVAEHAAILNGTSTYNCGPALASAIAAAQANTQSCAIVALPRGLINVAQTYILTSPVRFVGRGGAGAPGYSSFPTVLGTTIKYTGADTNAVLFTFNNINYGGAGMYGLALNGNGIARRGLILDAVLGFGSDDLHVTRFTNVLVGLISTGQTTSWNQFKNLYLEGEVDGTAGSTCLWLSGGNGALGVGANACHCTFENLHINHGGLRSGIYLGGVDNITFTMTYIFRASGTRPGVEVVHEQQGGIWFPVANTFYHLQAGVGGWVEPAGGNATYPTAVIYGYQTDNGQPLPVTNGRRLPYITNNFDILGIGGIGRTSYGGDWAGTVLATTGSTFTDVTFPSGPRSSAAYNIVLDQPTTIGWGIQNKTAAGFRIVWASALGADASVDWIVLGG